ncbi:MAG: hypothetical protein GY754_20490 [bacterium]|nr:hypothetical protein [bacterium]
MITFIVLCIAITILSSYIFSRFLLYSNRQPLTRSPKDYGMEYENIEFISQDGLKIKGWLIPGKSDTLIIQTHPFPFNRAGFLSQFQGFLRLFRTNVDLVNMAKVLNEKGYSVLMFDFRNHGESDSGITGIGLNEYQDVVGAINFIKSRKELASKKIAFNSFCMGANSTIIALSKEKELLRDVQCVVAVQPVSMLTFIISYTAKVFTQLGLVMLPILNKMLQLQGGYPLKDVSPIPYLSDLEIPILFIQTATDPWTNLKDVVSMYERTPGTKELLLIPEVMGRFDGYNWVSRHPEKILDFFDKHIK